MKKIIIVLSMFLVFLVVGCSTTTELSTTENISTTEALITDEPTSEPMPTTTEPVTTDTITTEPVVIEYQVDFNYEDSEGIMQKTSILVEEGMSITSLNVSRVGYTFIGWFLSEDEGVTLTSEWDFVNDIVNENVNLYASWQINQYTITFESNGGTSVDPITQDYDSEIIKPIPSRDGYTFDGWYIDSELTNEFSFEAMPAENVTVYAKWIEIVYVEVTYTQDFYFLTSATSNYSTTVQHTDGYGFPWTLLGRQEVGAWMLGNADDGSYIQVNAQNGISSISFDVVRTFTNINERSGEVFVNGNSIGTFTVDVNSDVAQNISFEDINISGNILIKIVTTSPGTRGSFNVDNIQWTTYQNSSGGAPEIDYTPPVITVNDPKTSYNVGETVNLGCTANDDVDGVVLCTYSGTVDNLTPGTYPITYTAVDSSSNEAVLVVDYVIIGTYPTSYYDGTEGLSGADLEAALRIIVNNGFSGVTYGESRYILDETDADPNIPGNLILVYRLTSVSGTWDNGITWNREHVWPQSLLGVSVTNSSINVGSDLHNLKPADPSENSSRNNKFYDDITTSVSYEPHSDVKGDLARILFYMVVMYDYLELKDLEDFTGIGEPGLYEMGLLEVLLSWHELDPVDDFERNRNNVIYYYQGNRNPFIDHEEFVALLFEDHPYYTS